MRILRPLSRHRQANHKLAPRPMRSMSACAGLHVCAAARVSPADTLGGNTGAIGRALRQAVATAEGGAAAAGAGTGAGSAAATGAGASVAAGTQRHDACWCSG